jgi:predicted ATPase
MFTGEEEVFAFRRCQSRLTEMAGERWALLANTGAGGSKNR